MSQLIIDPFVVVFYLTPLNPYLILSSNYNCFITDFFQNAFYLVPCFGDYGREEATHLTTTELLSQALQPASHINFVLQMNNGQRRSYKRTESVLVIDKISDMKEISVNSSVIAVHRPDIPEWFRAGNVTVTNERLSFVTVRFKNGDQKWIPLNQLRLVKRPKFCVDSV